MKIRTWHLEWLFVFTILAAVAIVSGNRPVEWLGVFAVLITFGHSAISDRMSERQALKTKPDVECYRWSDRYLIIKEVLWLAYFYLHQSYSALVGVFVFLLYPFWRRWYRRYGREKKRRLFRKLGIQKEK